MDMNLFNNDIFKQALVDVRAEIDEASERKVNIFGEPWYLKYFRWNDTPNTEDEFTTLLDTFNFDIAASTINRNSPSPLRGLDKPKSLKQQLFYHSHTYKIEEETITNLGKQLKMLPQNSVGQRKAYDLYVKALRNLRSKGVNGIHNRMDIMILTLLSKYGKYTVNTTVDPESPLQGTEIDFGFDSTHKATFSIPWTEANINDVDVYQDIFDFAYMTNRPLAKILMRQEQLNYALRTPKLRHLINSLQFQEMPIDQAKLNTFLSQNNLPTIEVVNKIARVQSGAETTEFQPFELGAIVGIPAGLLGSIESGFMSSELGAKSPKANLQWYGRIEMYDWISDITDGSDYTEYLQTSALAAPSVSQIRNIYAGNVLENA